MLHTFSGLVSGQYAFELEGLESAGNPQFAAPGIFMYARKSPRLLVPLFVGASENMQRDSSSPTQLGTACGIHGCNVICFHFSAEASDAQTRKRIADDLIAAYLPPMNDQPQSLRQAQADRYGRSDHPKT